MLTTAQITAGTARLIGGKLKTEDVDGLVSVFRMFFAELESKYNYAFEAKLLDLNDGVNTKKQAAQVAACIIEMEKLGFGVSSLEGGRNALTYKEKDEYAQYVIIAFSKIYPIPFEWSQYALNRRRVTTRVSQTALSNRSETQGSKWGEKYWRA